MIYAQLYIVEDSSALALAAASLFEDVFQQSVASKGVCTVALSGGNTPRALYSALASPERRDLLDWSLCQVFFSDERFVPRDSTESNYHTAWEGLLQHVAIPAANVHAVPVDNLSPNEAAREYDHEIRSVVTCGEAGIPEFDLIYLGMGPDGHTASLFPGTEALRVSDRLVTENFVPKLSTWRVTFTYPLINAGAVVAFLVQGQDKAMHVAAAINGSVEIPAGRVHPHAGQLVWLVDDAAAGHLDQDSIDRLSLTGQNS